jgi:hypothetical protein
MNQSGASNPMGNETKQGTDDATTDESIGRPPVWREGRYEKPGMPKDVSVLKKPGEVSPDTTSTTVTKKDHEGI